MDPGVPATFTRACTGSPLTSVASTSMPPGTRLRASASGPRLLLDHVLEFVPALGSALACPNQGQFDRRDELQLGSGGSREVTRGAQREARLGGAVETGGDRRDVAGGVLSIGTRGDRNRTRRTVKHRYADAAGQGLPHAPAVGGTDDDQVGAGLLRDLVQAAGGRRAADRLGHCVG